MIRILHVEDNRDDAELTHVNLMRLSKELNFEWVSDGVKALDFLESEGFDCIICDYQMPVMSGLDLLRSLRQERHIRLPFIFLTGQGNEETAAQALREGADDYFSKELGFASYQRLLNSIYRNVVAFQQRLDKEEAERALRESEIRFRLLADNSSDMISRHAPDGSFIYVSPSCSQILGYQPEELIGVSPYDVIRGEDSGNVRSTHREIMANSGVQTTVYRMRRKDGLDIWLETTSKTIRDEASGEVIEIHAASRDISERKRAEQSLQESETRLRTVIHNMPIVLFTIDREGRFTLSEGAGLSSLGLKPGEAVGRSIHELYKDFPEVIAAYEQARAGKSFNGIQVVGDIVFDIVYSPLMNAEGAIDGVIGVASNSTARYFAEEQLLQSRALLQRINDSAPGIIYVLDLNDFSISFMNRQIGLLTGYNEEEVYQMGPAIFRELMHPADLPRISEMLKCLREDAAANSIEFEYRLRHRNGSWIWMLDRTVVFSRDENGVARQMLGTASDVTERKKLEVEFKESKEALRAIFDNVPVAIVINERKPPFPLVEANRTFVNLIGYDREELRPMLITDILTDTHHVKELLARFAKTGSLTAEKVRVRAKDGHYFNCLLAARAFEYCGKTRIMTTLSELDD